MNYKEVLALAESKGYKPILCHMEKYGGSGKLPNDIISKARQACELSLIQQWLRDTHKMDIEIENQFTNAIHGTWYFATVYKGNERKSLCSHPDTPYERALWEGINYALNII